MAAKDPMSLTESLERAKTTLKASLAQACSSDLERADTGELIRIEEVLAIANEAAKEVVSVRRRLRSTRRTSGPHERPASREIVDDAGAHWTVFAVHPSVRPDRPSVRERFREGWLSFDSNGETRRLVPIPEHWDQLSDAALAALCGQAELAPRRSHGITSIQTKP
jgi:hypothetical protein